VTYTGKGATAPLVYTWDGSNQQWLTDAATLGAVSLTNVVGGLALPLLTIVPIPWAIQRVIDPTQYTHVPGTPDVTVLNAGQYAVSFNVTPIMTAGFGGLARSTVLHALLLDVGAGFALVPGTIVASYHRITTNGRQTATLAPAQLALGAGSILRIASLKISGLSIIATAADGTNLTIDRVL
jgi:hypothetical protein